MPSLLLRPEKKTADRHLTQIQQVSEEQKLVHRAPGVTSVMLRTMNPGHVRPERHIMLAFKHRW